MWVISCVNTMSLVAVGTNIVGVGMLMYDQLITFNQQDVNLDKQFLSSNV